MGRASVHFRICCWISLHVPEKTFSGQRPAVTLPQLSYYESCYLNNSDVNNFFFQNPTFLTSLSPFTWSSPRLRAGINFHFTVWKKQAHILWWFFCAHSSCWLSSQKTLGLTENISLFYFFFPTEGMEAAASAEANSFPSGERITQLCLSSSKIRNTAAAWSATLKCSEPVMLCYYNTHHYLPGQESISGLLW